MNRNTLKRWIGKHGLMLLFIVFIALPTLGFVLGSATLLGYTYWPSKYTAMTIPAIDPGARHIFVLAHGLGDTTASWTDPLKAILEQDIAAPGKSAQVIALDWSPYSSAAFRCSVDGMRIGRVLGETLAGAPALQSLHLVGHSCGSFVVLGLCESLKKLRQDIQVQSTYLDPVSIYGGLFWNYGVDHFGECADFSEAYIDTEDGVPGSNELLPNAHTFDVTRVDTKKAFSQSPHVWPTHYYQQLVKSGRYPSLDNGGNLWTDYPRGTIEQVDKLPLRRQVVN